MRAILLFTAFVAEAASAQPSGAPQPVCRPGEAVGCYRLGLLQESGAEGVNRDEGRAAEAYGTACDAGHAAACSRLGALYRQGMGVPLDEGRAAALFDRACANGAPEGCVGLGLMYEDGLGVEQDGSRAATLYEKACSGGAAMGCKNLGSLYLAGLGVARNPDRALALLRQACVGGIAPACVEADRLVPFKVKVGMRGDADLLTPGLVASVTGELSRGDFSGVVTTFFRFPPAFRVEGRYSPAPLQWGPIRPYVAGGLAFFFSASSLVFASHAGVGVDLKLGQVHVLGELAYDRFFNAAPEYSADSLLLGIGVGWSF